MAILHRHLRTTEQTAPSSCPNSNAKLHLRAMIAAGALLGIGIIARNPARSAMVLQSTRRIVKECGGGMGKEEQQGGKQHD